MNCPRTAADYTAKKKRKGKEEEEQNCHSHKKNNKRVLSEKIKNILSDAFDRVTVTVVHSAVDMLRDIEKACRVALAFDKPRHIYILAGFFLEFLAASNRFKYLMPDYDILTNRGRETAHLCEAVKKKRNNKTRKEEHQWNCN